MNMHKSKKILASMTAGFLCFQSTFGMFAGPGVNSVTVLAASGDAVVSEPSGIHADELKVGQMLKKKTLIELNDTADGIYLDDLDVSFDFTELEDGGTGYRLEDDVIVVSLDSAVYLESIYGKGHVTTENILKALLEWDSPVSLHGDIILSETLVIDDGKEHTINLNGHFIEKSSDKDSPDGNVIMVTGGSKLILKDEKKTGGISGGKADKGGGISIDGSSSLTMNGGSIMENNAPTGGGIFVGNGSKAKLNGVTISENNGEYKETEADKIDDFLYQSFYSGKANKYKDKKIPQDACGGGVMVEAGGTCELQDCKIEGNYSRNGGGIWNAGTVEIGQSDISANYTADEGAGIYSEGETVLTESDISGNTSATNGGGIGNHKKMTMEDCQVSGNSAVKNGGGIYIEYSADSGKTSFSGTNTITQNISECGGGIYLKGGQDGKNIFKDLVLSENYASQDGGALYTDEKLKELELTNVTIEKNKSVRGGGITAHSPLSVTDSMVRLNTSEYYGGGIYTFMEGGKLTLTNSSVQENTSYHDGGAGIWLKAAQLVLGGGKTVIYMNRLIGEKDGKDQGSANDVMFADFKEIKVTGELKKGSMIGLNCMDSFKKRTMTKDYGDYNDKAPDTYFIYNGADYRVNNDDKLTEVEVVKRLLPSASGYQVKVKVKCTNGADWWYDAHLEVWCKKDHGLGKEFLKHSTGDIKKSIEDEGDEYTKELDCGDNFPSKINVYANFGAGLIKRDWEADVTVWVNGVNCASSYIVRSLWGNTVDKGQADNYIGIGEGKYPYPEEIEIDQKREIDLLDDKSKEVSISCVDQYGVDYKVSGKDNYKIENISFPEEDTAKCLDDYGMKWKFDSSVNACHNSVYKVQFKSGSTVQKWVELPISVRFKVPLKLKVKLGDQVVFEENGHQNDSIKITGIQADEGYKISKINKNGACILGKADENGDYDFVFLDQDVTLEVETKPITYKIVFDANDPYANDPEKSLRIKGSTNTMKGVAYDVKNVFLSPCKFLSQKGYVFTGWNTKPDGSGNSYADKAQVVNFTSQNGDVITLYAQWADEDGRSVTASIFSRGQLGMWGGLILIVVCGVIIGCYASVKRSRVKSR